MTPPSSPIPPIFDIPYETGFPPALPDVKPLYMKIKFDGHID